MTGAVDVSHEVQHVRSPLIERRRDVVGLAISIVAAGTVAAGTIACLAAVQRGLDVTDESYYILSALHPRVYLRSSTDFQLLLGPVLRVVRYVWILRLVNILALLVASAIFTLSFLRTAPTLFGAQFRRSEHLAIGAALMAGALMPSVFAPQTPGYNQMTLWILLCGSSLLLLLADHRVSKGMEPVAWLAVGLLAWFQAIIKWPAVVAFVPLAALALCRTKPRPLRVPVSLAAVGIGIVVGAVLTQLFLAPLPALVHGLSQGSQDLATYGGHRTSGLLTQYLHDLSSLGGTIARSYWYLLLAAVAGAILASTRLATMTSLALGIGLVLLTPLLIIGGTARGGADPWSALESKSAVLPAYVTFALVAAITASIVTRRAPNGRAVFYLASLLAMPLLSALGTNNPIWFNALFAGTFWVAAALVLLSIAFPDHDRYPVRGLAFAFATLIALTAVDGTWVVPYRQSPLRDDTVALTIPGPLGGLQVDRPTADFLQAVYAAVKAEPGSSSPTMVSWAGIPAAVVAGGVAQPLFAWVGQGTTPAQMVMKRSCESKSRGIFLLELPGGTDPVNDAAALPRSCVGRRWTEGPGFTVPPITVTHVGASKIVLYYAAPLLGNGRTDGTRTGVPTGLPTGTISH